MRTTKLIVVVAICMFAVAAIGQTNNLPATGTTQTPTYNNGATTPTSGVSKWGTTPAGANNINQADGFAWTDGQQFNSKWAMKNGNHDLTTYSVTGKTTSWTTKNVTPSRMCSFCHTAHDNEGTTDRTFLWAHAVPASFGTPYASPTLQSSPSTTATSQTAQCLGCHDGTVALSSGGYGTPALTEDFSVDSGSGAVALTSGGKLSDAALIVPLSRTHPVSFTYDGSLAAKHQLRVPANANSIDGFGIVPLFNGKMECATCHDPHIKTGIMRRQFPTGASQDNATGSFCLYCHL